MPAKKKTKGKKSTVRTKTVMRNVFQDGPHLQVATLCEKVLVEKDGVKTAVRMVDRLTATIRHPDAPETMPKMVRDLALLVKFKKGKAGSKHELRVDFVKPTGKVASSFSQTLVFEGGPERGLDFVANTRIELDSDGLYWFDVYLDEIRVTRIPLKMIYITQKLVVGGESPKQIH